MTDYKLLHAIVPKFHQNIFVHDRSTVRRHFEKNVIVTEQPVTITCYFKFSGDYNISCNLIGRRSPTLT